MRNKKKTKSESPSKLFPEVLKDSLKSDIYNKTSIVNGSIARSENSGNTLNSGIKMQNEKGFIIKKLNSQSKSTMQIHVQNYEMQKSQEKFSDKLQIGSLVEFTKLTENNRNNMKSCSTLTPQNQYIKSTPKIKVCKANSDVRLDENDFRGLKNYDNYKIDFDNKYRKASDGQRELLNSMKRSEGSLKLILGKKGNKDVTTNTTQSILPLQKIVSPKSNSTSLKIPAYTGGDLKKGNGYQNWSLKKNDEI